MLLALPNRFALRWCDSVRSLGDSDTAQTSTLQAGLTPAIAIALTVSARPSA